MIFQVNLNIMKHTIIGKLHQSIYLFTTYVYTMHNNTSESINAVKNSLNLNITFFCTKLFPDSGILVCLFQTHDLTTYFLKKTIYKSSKKTPTKPPQSQFSQQLTHSCFLPILQSQTHQRTSSFFLSVFIPDRSQRHQLHFK